MKAFDLTWMLLKQGRVGPIDHEKSPFPMGQTAMQDKYDTQRIIMKLINGEELTPDELRILNDPYHYIENDYGPMITSIDDPYEDELSEEEIRELYDEYERAYGQTPFGED
tara:strand:- start:849 stop:1181 length:333 start_codon:yes stop_codon:yes gene_type:complete